MTAAEKWALCNVVYRQGTGRTGRVLPAKGRVSPVGDGQVLTQCFWRGSRGTEAEDRRGGEAFNRRGSSGAIVDRSPFA